MLRYGVVLLFVLGSLGRPESLEKGPEPGEGETHEDKKHTKRQFLINPIIPQQYPFVPIYIPYQQVVEVHHVVMLQSPACVPQTGQPQPIPGYIQPGQQQPVPGYIQPGQQQPIFPPTTTQRPYQQPLDPGLGDRSGMNTTMPDKPSRCVWAIVACCSPDSTTIRYSCFELLGCPGAFWGVNPCEGRVVQAAANTALNFYMNGGSDENSLNNNSL